MKTAIVILLAIPLIVSAQLNDATHTRRVVSGTSVDISPAIKADVQGVKEGRPLKAWQRVYGTKLSENAFGWVVETKEGNILLMNPPARDFIQFKNLKDRFEFLTRRKAALESENNSAEWLHANSTRRASALENAANRSGDGFELFRIQQQRAAVAQTSKNAFDTTQANYSEISAIDGELKTLGQSGYNLEGAFPVNCYALKTGKEYQKMAVYDRGVIVP